MSLLLKAMTYDHPEELPVSVGMLPAMWKHYGTELVKLAEEYPDLIPKTPDLNNLSENLNEFYRYGEHVDEWGCTWSNIEEGMDSIVTGHSAPRREDVYALKEPENIGQHVRHGFMYLRLLDIRGFEEVMTDFAEECDELHVLIEKVLNYNCKNITAILSYYTNEIMTFGDDLGMQKGLAVGPERWRKYLKPCYKKMFSIVKDAGKYVYMHSDGMMYEIIPDLKDCGVDMVNPQIRANGLDNLVRVCKGKIAVNLDLDRQLFPFATPSELDDHVRECVEALYLPEGGLGLSIELNYEVPLKNVAALLDAARKYRRYRG